MRFHSAMATLEPQKYVIARTVGTENILLVSGRLVQNSLSLSQLFRLEHVLFQKFSHYS